MSKNFIELGKYKVENDIDVKITNDGWEIFPDAVEKYGIKISDFSSADWFGFGGIMVEKV